MASPWAMRLPGIIRVAKLGEPTIHSGGIGSLTLLVGLLLPPAERLADRRRAVVLPEAVGAVLAVLGLLRLVDAAQRQPEAAALRLDAQHAHSVPLTLLDDLARVRDVSLAELAHVDQPLDPVFEAGEGAEGRDARDRALHDVARVELLGGQRPRLGLGAAERERDLLPLAVDAEHHHVDLVADVDDVARPPDARPGELGEV